jgi:hypothetical protein
VGVKIRGCTVQVRLDFRLLASDPDRARSLARSLITHHHSRKTCIFLLVSPQIK